MLTILDVILQCALVIQIILYLIGLDRLHKSVVNVILPIIILIMPNYPVCLEFLWME